MPEQIRTALERSVEILRVLPSLNQIYSGENLILDSGTAQSYMCSVFIGVLHHENMPI